MDGERNKENGNFGLGFSSSRSDSGASTSSSSSSSSARTYVRTYVNHKPFFWGRIDSDSSSSDCSSESSSDSEEEEITQTDCSRPGALMELVNQEINKISPVTNIYAARYVIDLIALYFNSYDFIKPSMVMDFLSRNNIVMGGYFSMAEIMTMVNKNKKLGVFELERAVLFG